MTNVAVESLQSIPIWGQVLIILAVSVLAAKIIELLAQGIISRSARLTGRNYDEIFTDEIRSPLYLTVILAGVYASARLLPQVRVGFFISSAAMSILAVLWAYAIVQLGGRLIEANNKSPSGREITPVFKNLVTFSVIVATFFSLLSIWNLDATPLLASAGIIGLVLGIAAQDALGNFFSGISLYLDKTYKLGDMVELESGDRGTVIDMSIRSTTILTRDNIAITVPNGLMNEEPVINESAPVRKRRVRLNVGIAYGSELETVKDGLLGAADEEPMVLEDPAPAVQFREFGESAIVAQLQFYIEHPAQRGRARHALIERIDERFRDDEVKIPFPQRELSFADTEQGAEFDTATTVSERRNEQYGDR
ncbi:mechanosensitive ion channel family protein [Halobacteriaceae archaeon SHR40]|uniref:mechanosensitive ion channel family protein n=1 Tax=Halovenus amylolytica TaxID=2500550 RepID=UPI000FE3BD71